MINVCIELEFEADEVSEADVTTISMNSWKTSALIGMSINQEIQ